MNSKGKQPPLAVGVDVGASRTRVVVCLLEDGGLRYLSHGLAPGAGWAKGRVIGQGSVAESIHAAVVDAERGAGIPWISRPRRRRHGICGAQSRGAATNSAARMKWTPKI